MSLLDAKAAATLLNVPASWLLTQAREDRVPHKRLGKYVRFTETELIAWLETDCHDGPKLDNLRKAA